MSPKDLPDLLEDAEEYVDLGTPVIPSPFPSLEKWPGGWKPYQTRLPTKDELTKWFGNGSRAKAIMMITGKQSGEVVIDVDEHPGEPGGFDTLKDKQFELPDTPTVKTGSGGGRQYHFAHPGFAVKTGKIPGLPGVEIKGEGGTATLPPSLHKSGKKYRWVKGTEDLPLAPLPKWVLDALADDGGEDDDIFDHSGSATFVPPKLGRKAEKALGLRLGSGDLMYRYEGGVYRPDGDELLASFVRSELKDEFRENKLREVRAYIRAGAATSRIPTQPELDYINVKNGLLYWREDPPRLVAHSPVVPSIIQIPVEWRPGAGADQLIGWLDEMLPDEEVCDFLIEWLGYLLIPTTRLQRMLLLLGPRDTGKSTLLRLIETFIGSENIAADSLQAITDSRFSVAYLYGKLVNVCADIDAKSIQGPGRFKQLVAGDTIRAERKYGHPFDFHPFTRLVFSANEAPGTSDQSGAYYKRWLILPMVNQIPEKAQVDVAGTISAEALSGLLVLAVEGLQRLMTRNRFKVPQVMQQAVADYRSKTDTVVAFVEDRCELGRFKVGRQELFDRYTEWCSDNGKRPLGQANFQDRLLDTYRGKIDKVKTSKARFYTGIGLSDPG